MTNFIFDTDMGNDIDDAFAQAMLAQAHASGKANLALTVSSNPNPNSLVMIESVNRYYGAGGTRLAIHKGPLKYAGDSNGYCLAAARATGVDPASISGEDAVPALRRTLAELPDKSVRVVATGFATNLAGLLASPANFQGDGIALDGKSLVERKVELLSIMAADFHSSHKGADGALRPEFNVDGDVPSMKALMDSWPVPAIVSDFSIGLPVLVDWPRLERQLKDANPVKAAYKAFYKGEPGARQSWDQTSMLYALEPEAGHFALSEEGDVEILPDGFSLFKKRAGAGRRLLLFDETRTPGKVDETLHARFYLEP